MNQDTYTKIFLKQADMALTDENIKTYQRKWWRNIRAKDEGGLRLTDDGLEFVQKVLELKIYEIPFPPDLDMKPQVLLFLDKFIDCPYHLTENFITVLAERKSFELHLFAGDVRKYGLIKAMSREHSKDFKSY